MLRSLIRKHKRLIENLISLTAVKALNLLLPLISLPYLVRILGAEKYGAVSFVLVVIQYIVLISSYGFSFSGTQLVAQNRNDKPRIEHFLSSILVIRFVISLFLSVLLFGAIYFIDGMSGDALLYVMSLGIVFGDILNPVWLFQGMEKMKYLTITNLISKGLFTILIFVLVKEESDYGLVCLLTSVGYVVSGIISLIIALRLFQLKFVRPSIFDYTFQLKEGWHIFISTLSINLYRNSNILLLGLFTNDALVGLYAAAEKIIKALQAPISPISEALYPYFSHRIQESGIKQSIKAIFKIAKYYIIALLPFTLLIIIFAEPLTQLVFGAAFIRTTVNIQIMSFVILFGGLNYLFGIIGLLNMNKKKEFSRSVLLSGIIGIVITVTLSPYIQEKAASWAMLVSEFVLLIFVMKSMYKVKAESYKEPQN